MKPETRGELSIFASCLFFCWAAISAKLASGFCSGNAVSWVRFAIGGILALSLVLAQEKSLRIHDLRYWLLRGITGSLAMTACYLAIQMTSSGRATLLSNTYPIFTALFGMLFFKERPSWENGLGMALCFAGVVLVFEDHSRYSLAGNMMGLASGLIGGLTVQFLKKARVRNSSASIYLSACLFGLLLNGAGVRELRGLPGKAWIFLALTAVLAWAGQWWMAHGYRFVSATQGSVIGFFETLLTLSLSYCVVGEEMRGRFFWGAGVIVIGLLVNQGMLSAAAEKLRRPVRDIH